MEDSSLLHFTPFSSCINPSFWHKFSQMKLEVFKLDENIADIWGYYTNLNCRTKSILEVDSTSFNSEYNGLKFCLPYHGSLINKNTIEEFKQVDKKLIIHTVGSIIENNIKLGHAIQNPSLLNCFLILSFADLKKYNFYYWFAFPALCSIKPYLLKNYTVTELCNEHQITVNAALGFDTYLIMRHGIADTANENVTIVPFGLKCIPGNKLGCYFCSDITAPGDTLKDRTLDQQCTVTRPGVANIAAALAVELAVSIIEHEKGPLAPAFYRVSKSGDDIKMDNECCLGIVPHSIRGFLCEFNHILPATERYSQCTACSEIVVKQYEKEGFDFLLQVLNNSSYLEDITGLNNICSDGRDIEDWPVSEDNDST